MSSLRSLRREIAARYAGQYYTLFHAPRYLLVLDLLSDALFRGGQRVLDIGRSHLTSLIAEKFKTEVDSLGFDPDGQTETGRHYAFDLNRCEGVEGWRTDLPQYDLIVMCEVIEHLHVSPVWVLAFLNSLLSDRGVLLLQTPNAVVLTKRLKMMLGRNPYELIRHDNRNPGHFREYTRPELLGYAGRAGFTAERWLLTNSLDLRYKGRWVNGTFANSPPNWASQLQHRTYVCLYKLCPGSVRPLVSLVLRKTGPAPMPPKPVGIY